MADNETYPAKLDIAYPEKLDRLTTLLRPLWVIPIVVLVTVLSGGGQTYMNEATNDIKVSGASLSGGLAAATALMIIFRQRYPKWWFDFVLELNRFFARVAAYVLLLTDKYPSTVDKQDVELEVKYPDVKNELSWWMPIVKWLLAIPHYFVLAFLFIGVGVATVIAWFSILFTGKYPKGLFDYVVGVLRWSLRVNAYAFLLTTDQYPPFSLK